MDSAEVGSSSSLESYGDRKVNCSMRSGSAKKVIDLCVNFSYYKQYAR